MSPESMVSFLGSAQKQIRKIPSTATAGPHSHERRATKWIWAQQRYELTPSQDSKDTYIHNFTINPDLGAVQPPRRDVPVVVRATFAGQLSSIVSARHRCLFEVLFLHHLINPPRKVAFAGISTSVTDTPFGEDGASSLPQKPYFT